jgi:hypothetical protein
LTQKKPKAIQADEEEEEQFKLKKLRLRTFIKEK